MAKTENPKDIAGAAVQLAAARPKYKFTVPESAKGVSDPSVVVLQPITLGEEKMASKSAEVSGNLAYECLKHSIVEADGVRVTWDNGAKDIFLDGLSPKCRDLLLRAYAAIHIPKDKETNDFLGSMNLIV